MTPAFARPPAPAPAAEEILYVAAPLLLLAAPLTGFIAAAGYGWARAEVLLSVAVLILLGLGFGAVLANAGNRGRAAALALLAAAAADLLLPFALVQELVDSWAGPGRGADWRWTGGALAAALVLAVALFLALRKAAVLLCAAGAAALAAWLAAAGGLERDRALVERGAPAAAPAAAEAPPPLVHLVLEGHGALAALRGAEGAALRAEIEKTYVERGFRVFPRAFGQYYDDRDALPALANLDTPERASAWLDPARRDRPAPTAAAWLDLLADRGYAVAVHQDDRLDLCAAAQVRRCVTRNGAGPAALAPLALPTLDKFAIFWGLYLERSDAYTALRRLYRRHAVPFAENLGVRLPAWSWRPGRLDSLAAGEVAGRVAAEVRAGGAGSAWIVRLPAPAAPWAHDGECALVAEPRRWLRPRDRARVWPRINDESGLQMRRKRLRAELGCAHRRVAAILDAVDETPAMSGAAVLVHGLAGSRAVAYEPSVANAGRAGPDDYLDGFGTFLAVRGAGAAPGVDPAPLPLQAAFPALAGGGVGGVGAGGAAGGAPAIRLRGRPGGPLARRPAAEALAALYAAPADSPARTPGEPGP